MNAYWSQTGWGHPRRIQPREDVGDRESEREEACCRADREGLSGETQQVKAVSLKVLEQSAREFHGYDFLQLIVLGI